jgi:ribose-phosphate pyrophosphokinase
MTRVLLALPGAEHLAADIANALGARLGRLDWRRFPDGESLLAVDEDLAGADVVLLACLRDPDRSALALRFAAATAREFGAARVGLLAPYLPYMRQDVRFRPGEAVNAPLYAQFLGESFDWLVTSDPHLHRIPSLDRIYRIPTRVVEAAPEIARWIRANVPQAIVIGPDSESLQWVGRIGELADLPFQVLAKVRHGDREVEVSLPDAAAAAGRAPVVVDDIASSGMTMVETLRHLAALGLPPASCVVTHALFADEAVERMRAAGASRIASTDTLPHASNAIGMAAALAEAADAMMVEKGAG